MTSWGPSSCKEDRLPDSFMEIGGKEGVSIGVKDGILVQRANGVDMALGSGSAFQTTVNMGTAQSIPNNVVTQALWSNEREDSPNWFDPTNPGYIVVNTDGIYIVTVQVGWVSSSVGTARSHHLQLDRGINGSVLAAGARGGGTTPSPGLKWENPQSIFWAGRLQAGDKLSVWVYQDSGGALNFGGYNRVSPPTTSANSEFTVVRIG